MKIIVIIHLFFFLSIHSFAQNALVDVADLTLKIAPKSEETLYYGFAEGDQILFSFKETDGNELKEVEIMALPESSKFKDYETKLIVNKQLKVVQKGIYKFRFYNGALLKGRVCTIKIQRIPKDKALMNFNTGIKWIETMDTTYELKSETVVNSPEKQLTRKVLTSVDTNLVSLIDRTERVSAMSKLGNSNTQYISIKLPQNIYLPNNTTIYEKTEVISWAYAIAVGGTGQAWYKSANEKAGGKIAATLAKSAAGWAVKAGTISTGYGALAILAIEGVSAFSNPPQGDNIKFGLLANINNQVVFLDSGNSVAASGKVTQYTQGEYTLKLENDNYIEDINVDVKVIAVTVTQKFADENYTVKSDAPLKEKKMVKVPKVKIVKTPIFVD
ncbi:MAG: hypothetical protein U5L45_00200 [Saprospiraceae bacterium]|nr:hypothetical protein [Saprospiraceae bacterium]